MNVVAIIQARMGSTRLPQKVLSDLSGKPMLEHIVDRVSRCTLVDKVVIATSTKSNDDAIEKFAKQYGFFFSRGSEDDVLERYYFCALEYNADVIIRLTGDNALIDSALIDEGVETFFNLNCDYLKYKNKLPLGLAVEIFTFDALKTAYLEADDVACREHVTPYLYCNPEKFRCTVYEDFQKDYSNLRWTVDTQEDYNLISKIYKSLYPQNHKFGYTDILNEYEAHPEWGEINRKIEQKKVGYKNS